MTDETDTMEKLRELEKEEIEAKWNLRNIQADIGKILSKFQRVRIDSWDGAGSFEDGIHVINASVEKVEPIKEIESGHKGDFVVLKSGEKEELEKYFTPEEVNSIRKY